VHHQAAVNAEGLTHHVLRARRHEESNHVGDVLRAFHAPQGDLGEAPAVNSSGDCLSSAPCSRAMDVYMSVSTKPGHTQFTRIPSAAWASARLLVMLMTAALLALYGRLARLPILPAIDADSG
jgi:hypothetical protein